MQTVVLFEKTFIVFYWKNQKSLTHLTKIKGK